jgi:hypothetical protein
MAVVVAVLERHVVLTQFYHPLRLILYSWNVVFYIRSQCVPHSKHYPPRLHKNNTLTRLLLSDRSLCTCWNPYVTPQRNVSTM